jgi:hypothetical protein
MKNTEVQVDVSKEVGVEENADKTNCVFIF